MCVIYQRREDVLVRYRYSIGIVLGSVPVKKYSWAIFNWDKIRVVQISREAAKLVRKRDILVSLKIYLH